MAKKAKNTASKELETEINQLTLEQEKKLALESAQRDVLSKINELEMKAEIVLEAERKNRLKREEEQRLEMLLDEVSKKKQEQKANPQPRNYEDRELQGREFAERDMYLRRFMKNQHMGKLFVDQADIPNDEVWFWASKEIMGRDNMKGLQNLFFDGWKTVKPHEAPSLCQTNENSIELGFKAQNMITVDASVLLKRKKDIHNLQLGVWYQRQREVENNAANITNSMSDERVSGAPVHVEVNEQYYSPVPF